jgi:hypothetical protein
MEASEPSVRQQRAVSALNAADDLALHGRPATDYYAAQIYDGSLAQEGLFRRNDSRLTHAHVVLAMTPLAL